jgi:hypothetical protein
MQRAHGIKRGKAEKRKRGVKKKQMMLKSDYPEYE